jgi:hypothetical protein
VSAVSGGPSSVDEDRDWRQVGAGIVVSRAKAAGQAGGPGPGLLNTQVDLALSAGDAGGDVQQPVAQLLGFGSN